MTALPSHERIAVLADAHLSGEDPEALEAFEAWIESLPSRVDAVVLLGDLFDIWIGQDRMLRNHQRRILGVLNRIGGPNLPIYLLEGNRDLHVRSLAAPPFAAVRRRLGMEVGGLRVWMEHGDLVNRADRPYRAWSRFVRSAPVRAAVRWLPRALVASLLDRAERALRTTNRRHKVRFPKDWARRLLADRAGRGWDLVLLGHFHRERRIQVGEAALLALPAWLETRQWLLLDADGPTLMEGPIPRAEP